MVSDPTYTRILVLSLVTVVAFLAITLLFPISGGPPTFLQRVGLVWTSTLSWILFVFIGVITGGILILVSWLNKRRTSRD